MRDLICTDRSRRKKKEIAAPQITQIRRSAENPNYWPPVLEERWHTRSYCLALHPSAPATLPKTTNCRICQRFTGPNEGKAAAKRPRNRPIHPTAPEPEALLPADADPVPVLVGLTERVVQTSGAGHPLPVATLRLGASIFLASVRHFPLTIMCHGHDDIPLLVSAFDIPVRPR